jgi:protocatechuate 3,4-dioxygenase beta subunit
MEPSNSEQPSTDLVNRRRALMVLGGTGLAAVIGAACKSSSTNSAASAASSASSSSTSSTSASTSSSTSSGSSASSADAAAPTSEVPDETGGPYPGDGSNGPDVLTQSGIVRNDIRTSFGSYSGTAEGVPLTIALRVFDLKAGAVPLSGAAVYVWHCDRDGNYSLYTVRNQNYLRGVQTTDANGQVTFTSIFPACYSGRWPHIHFEVYSSIDAATSGGTKLKTSQVALPEDACGAAYAATGYSQSITNLSRVSLSSDMVFSDGYSSELATVTGSVDGGYTATLNLAV